MTSAASFRLKSTSLIVLLVSAAFAGQAGAAGGRVDFATGTTISGADGRQKPLTKGIELDKGDTIRTDTAGRAQIRFPDGAYISLQPNTEFSIKDYNYEGKTDGSERSFFALAKGAMRTVTGLIGRVNKNRYQIATPTATIGIRGTGGLISIGPDGSTLVNGSSGIWTISNPAGTIDVPAGTTGKAPAAPNQPPQQTTEKPSTGPTQPATTQLPYSQADNRAPDGTTTTIPSAPPIVPLTSGSGYAAVIAPGPYSFDPVAMNPADAIFNSAGQLTSIKTSSSFQFTLNDSAGSHAEFGTDGILAWGRWIGQVDRVCDCNGPANFGPNQGLHYVVGMPTPVMPTSGTATYSQLGATSPTLIDGSASPGTFKLNNLSVTFGATAAVNLNFDVTVGGLAFRVDAPGTASSAQISFSPTVTDNNGSTCVQGCSGTVQGFFAGASAERVGVGYAVTDGLSQKTAVGAAAFKKQ